MNHGVSLVTLGLSAFKRKLKAADKARVEVGIFSDHNARDDGETNAEVGAKMEFGSFEESVTTTEQEVARGRRPMSWQGNPARSFLHMPINTELPSVLKAEREELIKSFTEDGPRPMLERVGFMAEAVIQDAFDTGGFGSWPENSEKTKKWKGSDKPLIDSSQLRESISSRVK